MKNTMNITLGNINLVIEGQPVQLENINLEYTNECSVQELAASASFIKDMVNEVKSMIEEAQASAHAYNQYPKVEVKAAEPKVAEPKEEVKSEKVGQRWDLPAVWSCMIAKKPEGFKKTGVGHYTYECGSVKEKNRIRVILEFKAESIDVDITVAETTAFCHLYEDAEYSSISGINAALIGELIEALPDDIKDFVSDYIKKITK
jgi:hypothetical protein